MFPMEEMSPRQLPGVCIHPAIGYACFATMCLLGLHLEPHLLDNRSD